MPVPSAVGSWTRRIGMALVLLLGMGVQVSAATITATFAGTVKSGLDSTGVFGSAGADLTGAAYKLVFTIDTAVGAYSTFNGTITDPLLSGDQVFGGKSAALTINGQSYFFPGTGSLSSNFAIAASKPGEGRLFYQASNMGQPQVLALLGTTNPGAWFPTSILTAVALTSCPVGECSFYSTFNIPIPGNNFFGELNFGSLNVSQTPIPAALPLLVSALGGLGFLGWRRRKAEAAA